MAICGKFGKIREFTLANGKFRLKTEFLKFLGIQPTFMKLITLKFWFLVVGFRFGNACTSKTAKFNEDSEKIRSLRQAMESLYAQRLNRLDFISAKDRFHPFDDAVVAVRHK